jgi:transposase InsO family protein
VEHVFSGVEVLRKALTTYIYHFYNLVRLHSSLDYVLR